MLAMMESERNKAVEIGQKSRIEMSGVTFAVIDIYKDMIYRTALAAVGNNADAEDILQEVFLKYFKTHPVFESREHEKAWFLRVTINESKNLLRSAWRRRRVDVDIASLGGQTAPGSNPVLEAVLSLPEKYRIAIYLHYFEDYTIKEIAGITGSSESAVAQHLTRGRKRLEKQLGGYRK